MSENIYEKVLYTDLEEWITNTTSPKTYSIEINCNNIDISVFTNNNEKKLSPFGEILKKTAQNVFLNIRLVGIPSLLRDCSGLFADCTCLKNVDTFSFLQITNATAMFKSCTSLEELDLSPLENANIENIAVGCTSLKTIAVTLPISNITYTLFQKSPISVIRCYGDDYIAIRDNLKKNRNSTGLTTISDSTIWQKLEISSTEQLPALKVHGKIEAEDLVIQGTSSNTVIDGKLSIKGNQSDQNFMTRGIVGSDGNTTKGDLYLQYNANHPIYFGNNGTYTISADGSYYSGISSGVKDYGNEKKLQFSQSNGGNTSWILGWYEGANEGESNIMATNDITMTSVTSTNVKIGNAKMTYDSTEQALVFKFE